MTKKGITKYALTYKYGINPSTLVRLRRNESITTYTLNQLCGVLDCSPEEILTYIPDNNVSYEITTEDCVPNGDQTKDFLDDTITIENEPPRANPAEAHSKKLYTLMQKKSVNARTLHQLSGIPVPTIRNILYGKTKNPRIETLKSIAKALEVNVEEL